MSEKKPGPDPVDVVAEPAGQIDAVIQGKLGAMLKQHYDDLISAPIPDQFLVLLAELEAKEKAGGR